MNLLLSGVIQWRWARFLLCCLVLKPTIEMSEPHSLESVGFVVSVRLIAVHLFRSGLFLSAVTWVLIGLAILVLPLIATPMKIVFLFLLLLKQEQATLAFYILFLDFYLNHWKNNIISAFFYML
jgi:hypothetical protein